MAKAHGLMNPKNASKSAGPFKEGFVRVDSNSYRVHQNKAGEGQAEAIPATKWFWGITRLAEDGTSPLLDEHDEPITEELFFSFGGKCLPFVHPGRATSPEDEEPEDLGTELNTEGNTIFVAAPNWTPNERSAVIVLTRSMATAGINSMYYDRCWAPDWNGCVFYMTTQVGDKGADGRSFNYKIVSKVLTGPGSKKNTKAAAVSAPNGKPAEAEAQIAPILTALSEELDGQSITRKAFLNRVRGKLEETKIDSKLMIPTLNYARDDKWLIANGPKYDFSYDPDTSTITFGSPAA